MKKTLLIQGLFLWNNSLGVKNLYIIVFRKKVALD